MKKSMLLAMPMLTASPEMKEVAISIYKKCQQIPAPKGRGNTTDT